MTIKVFVYFISFIFILTGCSAADSTAAAQSVSSALIDAEPSPEPTATPTPKSTAEPSPSPTPESTAEPSPSPTPESTAEPLPSLEPNSNSKLVAIDAGHQQRGNNEQEPVGPGADEKKAKVAGGTSGSTTGVPEYRLTLDVSLVLRDVLTARGYTVYMIRETNDVNISNKERADLAAGAGADILVRVHADGNSNSGANGIMTICPTPENPFVPNLYAESRALSDCLLDELVSATGAKDRGVWETDTMSGINWSAVPVSIVEMGFMTNPDEDRLMQTPEYRLLLAEGMANGIDLYFNFDGGGNVLP